MALSNEERSTTDKWTLSDEDVQEIAIEAMTRNSPKGRGITARRFRVAIVGGRPQFVELPIVTKATGSGSVRGRSSTGRSSVARGQITRHR